MCVCVCVCVSYLEKLTLVRKFTKFKDILSTAISYHKQYYFLLNSTLSIIGISSCLAFAFKFY